MPRCKVVCLFTDLTKLPYHHLEGHWETQWIRCTSKQHLPVEVLWSCYWSFSLRVILSRSNIYFNILMCLTHSATLAWPSPTHCHPLPPTFVPATQPLIHTTGRLAVVAAFYLTQTYRLAWRNYHSCRFKHIHYTVISPFPSYLPVAYTKMDFPFEEKFLKTCLRILLPNNS